MLKAMGAHPQHYTKENELPAKTTGIKFHVEEGFVLFILECSKQAIFHNSVENILAGQELCIVKL